MDSSSSLPETDKVSFFTRWDPRGLGVFALFAILFNVLGFGPEFHFQLLGNTGEVVNVPGDTRFFIAVIAVGLDMFMLALIYLMFQDVRRLLRGEPLAPPGMPAGSVPESGAHDSAAPARQFPTKLEARLVTDDMRESVANVAEGLSLLSAKPATSVGELRPSTHYERRLIRLFVVATILAVATVVGVGRDSHVGWAVLGVFGAIVYLVGLVGFALLQLIRATVAALGIAGFLAAIAAKIVRDDAASSQAGHGLRRGPGQTGMLASTVLRDSSRFETVSIRWFLLACTAAAGFSIALMGFGLLGLWLT